MDSKDDVVIAVMGSTGTGKSSFVSLLTGNPTVRIGTTLESQTSRVQVLRFVDPMSGRNIMIIDTPGFDDSRKGYTDTQILTAITEFLLKEYDKKRKLHALIYLQRISDPRFGGQSNRNLRMFRGLCGAKNYKNVVVLTTFWDRVDVRGEGLRRETQLKSEVLEDLIVGGACMMRFNRTIESARRVLKHILTLAPTNVRIQEEIRMEGKSLEDTEAGSVHREEIERIIAKHKAEMADLKAELEEIKRTDRSLRREIEEERAKLRQKLGAWETERSALKKGLDEAKESRGQLEMNIAKEKETHEKSRRELASNHSAKLNAQEKAHGATFQKLEDQLNEDVEARRKRELKEEKRRAMISRGHTRKTPRNTAFNFAYSDEYPPYLESIPCDYQTADIFDFVALVQTTSMLFVDPEVLPAVRERAPDQTTTHSMQDLIDRNLRLHLESRRALVRDMYSSPNIGLRQDWYTDAAFGQQQFTGTNPTTITAAPRQWIEEFTTVSRRQQRGDVTELLGNDPGSLFVQDYSDFRSLMGVSPDAQITCEGRYGCASVVLFRLEPEGKLHPLAITLDYKGSMERSVTIFNRRPASSAPGDESIDWPWRYAKMSAQVSDWVRHEISVHLVYTHLVEEVLIVSAHRTLDPSHIVFNLLEPHWQTTLPLNAAARSTLVPKIIIPSTGFTAPQMYRFIQGTFNEFDWTGSYVPNDLRRRGFPIRDLDKLKYHNYGYARNILRIWEIIRKFVTTVLTEVYVGGDEEVASDTFLADFCQEVRSGGGLASFPDITTLDELIDFVTMGIHIASPQHTAVNYLQQYYQTFVPNKPSALYSEPPRSLEELQAYGEGDILWALPIHQPQAWLIMAQVPFLLSFEVPDDSTILHYAATTSSLVSAPRPIRDAARILREDFEAFVSTVLRYSSELDDQQTPYLVLDPARTAISILI